STGVCWRNSSNRRWRSNRQNHLSRDRAVNYHSGSLLFNPLNDSNTKTLAGHFPTFRRLSGWLFSWRVVRRCLFVLGCLATLLALFYAEENWRGWCAWNKYRRDLEVRGGDIKYRRIHYNMIHDEHTF